jgi:predicted O-methyltransferase YrrM
MNLVTAILNHPEFASSKRAWQEVNETIEGRIPHARIRVLYLLRKILKNNFKNYVEIGVHNGGSMGMVMEAKYPLNAVGVDLFRTNYEKGAISYERDELSMDRTRENIDRCRNPDQVYKLVQGHSNDPETIEAVKAQLSRIDVLFIDGDHRLEGVKKDFEDYAPLVRKGGVILFDDYADRNHPGVAQFVDTNPFWGFHVYGDVLNTFIIQRGSYLSTTLSSINRLVCRSQRDRQPTNRVTTLFSIFFLGLQSARLPLSP